MLRKKLAFVLGIRPDVIRASLILKMLKKENDFDTLFIWSGQHYSDNLKDIFFRELDVPRPDIDLGCGGNSDAEIVSSMVLNLHKVLVDEKPDAVMFLGDTNTVSGCIAVAQLNIPIIHIEGCMRSYDWRMPEEKYRSLIDHLSDLIYCYLDEYKQQGIDEGINPNNVTVVGNPIVDILNNYYFSKKSEYDEIASNDFFTDKKIEKNKFYLMTAHRRENVEDKDNLNRILTLVENAKIPVYFPASYRTQKCIKEYDLVVPKNLFIVDPIGYKEFLTLMVNSKGIITDSGTVVEEACILKIPTIQMRKSTERPQVYDVGASIKFDPSLDNNYNDIFRKFEFISKNLNWVNPFGDGKSSERIVSDLKKRLLGDGFKGHLPENYHISIKHSFSNDNIK